MLHRRGTAYVDGCLTSEFVVATALLLFEFLIPSIIVFDTVLPRPLPFQIFASFRSFRPLTKRDGLSFLPL